MTLYWVTFLQFTHLFYVNLNSVNNFSIDNKYIFVYKGRVYVFLSVCISVYPSVSQAF